MLLQQGAERSEQIDLRLACTLSAVAGALNGAALYVAGFFAANMTGNLSAASDHLALGNWGTAGFYLLIIAAFILGAMICAILINAGIRRGIRSIYALMVGGEALILVAVWAVWTQWDVSGRMPLLVLGLSFAMGLQNATATRISAARVRTTHISGMATDIGIELGILFDRVRGKALAEADRQALSRLSLHAATITCFLMGGIVGVIMYLRIGSALLLVCAAVLMALSASALLTLRRLR